MCNCLVPLCKVMTAILFSRQNDTGSREHTLSPLGKHLTSCLVTCLAILFRHKFHEPLPSVRCPEICMSRKIFICRNSREKQKSVLLRAIVIATKTLRDKFISGHVTLRNASWNLCCNGAMKLRDKLRDKLSNVTAPKVALEAAKIVSTRDRLRT